jgi:hypothetical protein
MFFTGLSWLSIVIAAVAAFIGGWIWYSPLLFGKIYMKEIQMGMTPESMAGKPKPSMVRQFSLVFVGQIVMAIVAASLVHSLFVTSFAQVSIIALSLWAGFIVFTKMNDVLFGCKSWKLFLITIGQDLLSIVFIFAIVSLFN